MPEKHSTGPELAGFYGRMSDDHQETSIADQRAAVQAYAQRHGYAIVAEYVDEGISGDDTERREAFQRLVRDAVNGAFMLMRRRALEEVGLFDESFWMYMEDLDLCYRFKQAGWTTWYEPAVTVVHVKAGTSGKLRRPRLNYAFHYGMFRFYRKHYAADANPAVNVTVYAGIALKLALSIVSTELRRLVRSVASGSIAGRVRAARSAHTSFK